MHDFSLDLDRSAAAARRWKGLGMLSAGAALLHLAALGGLEWAWPAQARSPLPALAMQVRVIDAVVPAEHVSTGPAAALPAPATPPVATRPARVKAVVARAQPAPSAVTTTIETRSAPEPEEPAAAIQLALNTPAAAPATPAAGDEAIPHYRTKLPPAITLRYEMHKGILSGTGDLAWRPAGDHYALKFEARVSGLSVLTQESTGDVDASGIAPVRFLDQRLRRSAMAANFQRAAGKVTFSGTEAEFALREGTQDRLSWMVQLAAIVAAEPKLSVPGAKVVMVVVGSHGEFDVWAFRCIGPETVPTGAGAVDAIKYLREPREAYDTTVQVWLDPKRFDLPVRAVQKSGPNDDGYDLRLREVVSPN